MRTDDIRKTLFALLTLAAASLPAQANPADEAPTATPAYRQALAGYTRQALDRGGWFNPWAPGTQYTAGQPLLNAAVGSGVTSPGQASPEPARLMAAR